jgi:ribosomal protein S18 acetylase RimI-like enzyme
MLGLVQLRYLPERPLPERAFLPGRGRRPTPPALPIFPRPADEWWQCPDFLYAVDLFNAGFYWEAHEMWEGMWRQRQDDRAQRELLQGLLQCAAFAVHARRGCPAQASDLLARALAHLASAGANSPSPFMGIDVSVFSAAFASFAAAAAGGERCLPPRLELLVRSRDRLATLTSLRVLPPISVIETGPAFLLVTTPDRPDFHHGHALVLDHPPASAAAAADWFEVAAAAFAARSIAPPVLYLMWETESADAWPGAGQAGTDQYKHRAVLRGESAPDRRALPAPLALREVQIDADWKAIARLSATLHSDADFAHWRYQQYARSFAGGSGRFWAAFEGDGVADRAVGSVGLYESPGLLRFQEVQTDPMHRRRGIAGALLAESWWSARQRHPRAVAAIVAEPDSGAERLYRRLGMSRTGSQHLLLRVAGY